MTREDNEDWRRITRLDITAEEKDTLDLKLTFDVKGTRLTIIGDDRDEGFLLFSDIRDYIQTEVAVVRAFTKDSGVLGSAIVMMLVMLSLFGPLLYRDFGRSQ